MFNGLSTSLLGYGNKTILIDWALVCVYSILCPTGQLVYLVYWFISPLFIFPYVLSINQINRFISPCVLSLDSERPMKPLWVIVAGQSHSAVFKLFNSIDLCLYMFIVVSTCGQLFYAVNCCFKLTICCFSFLSFQCLLQASIYGSLKLLISVSVC